MFIITYEIQWICMAIASFMGREGSRHGILDYTEIKYVCFSGI